MKIEFFLSGGCLDNRSLDGGVYTVDLLCDGVKEKICLYVGESGCIVKRCAKHLQCVSNDPAYFGLTKDDFNSSRLTISFSVYKVIEGTKKLLDSKYKREETAAMKDCKPVTQEDDSDNMKELKDKCEAVQQAMKAHKMLKD